MIRVGNYSTAFFDVKNRVLGLPSWNVSDKNVADLLVGHEVGHALHTPVDAHAEFTARYPKAPFDVANIVEDIRIERLIQENFPGLITPFRNGYSYFLEKDFFKIAGKDVNAMSFLDRLNLKGKLRTLIDIEFTPEEQLIFEACDSTKTWNDVLEVCGRVIEYIGNTPNPACQAPQPQEENGEASGKSNDEQDANDDTQNLSHDSPQESETKPNGEGTKAADQKQQTPNQVRSQEEPDFSCTTQDNFDSELNKLHDGCDFSSINTPIKSDFEKCIFDLDKIQAGRRRNLSRYNDIMTGADLNELWKDFKISSKKSVASFVREFERKKSAYEYSRATVASTGAINVNKLHAYRYDDQIFKSVTRLAKSKSHGMAFFLDCSQSMEGVIRQVVKQTLELVWFCKAVGIPFIVYGFTSNTYNYDHHDARFGENIDFRACSVYELLNSNLNKNEFETASKEFFANYVYGRNTFGNHYECMSGTPLYETTIIAAHIVNEFREKTGVQKMNTIFISDGDGSGLSVLKNDADRNFDKDYRAYSMRRSFVWHKKEIKFHLSDVEKKAEMASRLMQDFKAITGSNTLCFFIPTAGKKDIVSKCANAYITSDKFPSIKTWGEGYQAYEKNVKSKRKDDERVIYIPGGFGFDGYFVMRDGHSSVALSDEDFVLGKDIDCDSRGGRKLLAKEFTKHNANKKQSRVFLTKFMDLIA